MKIAEGNVVPTLTSHMGTGGNSVPLLLEICSGCDGGGIAIVAPYNRVRELTPTECGRLQGFSDWWCADLSAEDPTADELSFWREVFGTWTGLTGKKRKTDKQIIKWLKSPHSDSAEYKMWGNGVALPCVEFVLGRIARKLKGENVK